MNLDFVQVDEATEDTNVASAIESRVASSLHLGSPTEYRYWLVALVKRLAKAGQETRLRALLDSLLGPPPRRPLGSLRCWASRSAPCWLSYCPT